MEVAIARTCDAWDSKPRAEKLARRFGSVATCLPVVDWVSSDRREHSPTKRGAVSLKSGKARLSKNVDSRASARREPTLPRADCPKPRGCR